MPSIIDIGFLLPRGWALKGNQKLGNIGGSTRIKKNIKSLLESFFLNGNRRAQDRMNAQIMHDAFLKYAKDEDIEKKDIPKISTIKN
ncbi:10538_t:CDS:2 [Cetraspora pellucida]|uniref:10538_t:CDS:1 n=1 Tax=Cetraspora pellucida TaxID=1433469 RepID=A0ACA9MQG0_9GLOM|nr:10538_t:CDS:2 [Cetraspora pellucida]